MQVRFTWDCVANSAMLIDAVPVLPRLSVTLTVWAVLHDPTIDCVVPPVGLHAYVKGAVPPVTFAVNVYEQGHVGLVGEMVTPSVAADALPANVARRQKSPASRAKVFCGNPAGTLFDRGPLPQLRCPHPERRNCVRVERGRKSLDVCR